MQIGYARVSTQEQNLDLQLDALHQAGIEKIYTDKVSGAKALKPQLEELLAYIRPGDTLVVWRLDRLGRTTVQLISLVEELSRRGVHFRSLTEQIDTASSSGKLVFQIFCALAEHERNVLRERTLAGLSAARSRGRVGGRPKGISEKYLRQADIIRQVYDAKTKTTKEIMAAFGITSTNTLYRLIRHSKEMVAKSSVKN